MNSAVLRPWRGGLLLLLVLTGFRAAADTDFYQDEDYGAAGLPAFTYSFPAQEDESSPFVRPSDPRYYHDTRGEPGLDPRPEWRLPSQTVSTAGAEDKNDSSVSRMMLAEPAGSAFDVYFIAMVAGCSAAAAVAVIAIIVGWCRWQKRVKAAAEVEYPAYGVTGPNKEVSPTGDRRLAHSAQMYHYQHQKQQILAMESSSRSTNDRNGSVSDPDSDEENEEGDYTVYECPGPAPIGEMEVRNPLFLDDPTPATPQGRLNGAATNAK
ncbi:neural proliferation differentiation and control protein 1 [Bacillus rossius redtenbacheri]|uniref:neural proliferation differentiation and control protein 1 n=1 Tax=Bacillus rossius redtenbacheri TaxID=93214 RepID=UPI002FDD550C